MFLVPDVLAESFILAVHYIGGRMTAKIKKCYKCRVKLPDIMSPDSYHLRCIEIDEWDEMRLWQKYNHYNIDDVPGALD